MKQGFGPFAARALLALGLSFTTGIPGGALAGEVYTWVDEDGVIHFSDVKPQQLDNAETLELDETYEPGNSDAYTDALPSSTESEAETAAGEEPEAAAAEEPEPQLTRAQQIRQDMERDRQRRKEEKAATEFLCDLHRKRLEEMEPARRVYYTNEAGETVRMDDDERVALVQESNTFVDRNCQ